MIDRHEKGQGLTEYVLILAFVAGIAIAMFGSGDLKSSLVTTFTKAQSTLAELFGDEKQYAYYFHKWSRMSLADLTDESKNPNSERIKADQEALALIAQAFLSKTPSEAMEQLKKFTNGNSSNNGSALLANNATEGYSQGILVPFSYYDLGNFDESGYIRLDRNPNYNTVKYLASDAEAYEKNNSILNGHTITRDRMFYSNDMLGDSDSSQRTVSARLHYSNGVVDSVDITARQGGYNGTIATGLNLTVTKSDSGITVTENNYDYVTNPNQSRI